MENYKQYKDHNGQIIETAIIRLSDGSTIPFDPNNIDYQKYLEWVAKGNEPLPADE